jgi:ribonuclease VapC
LTAIVIDTSAIIAILLNESEKDQFLDVILGSFPRYMSAVSVQEAGMVVLGRFASKAAWEPLDAILSRLNIDVVAHDSALALIAREAFLRFGKGCHPAKLNFGDCAAYALAKMSHLPLLFKGDDFSKSDVIAAV